MNKEFKIISLFPNRIVINARVNQIREYIQWLKENCPDWEYAVLAAFQEGLEKWVSREKEIKANAKEN